MPSLEKMAGEIKDEVIDADDSLEEDFKAEAISSENMVRPRAGDRGGWAGVGGVMRGREQQRVVQRADGVSRVSVFTCYSVLLLDLPCVRLCRC